MPDESFITDIETTIPEIVSDWAVKVIGKAVDALMPDGRPWGMVKQTVDEQLQDYLQLRGSPEAWDSLRLEQSVAIAQKLTESGLDESDVLSLHPFDMATKFALAMSVRMEDELRKRAGKLHAV